MPLSTVEENRLADSIVASDLTARVHTGDPGNNNAANRIGTITAVAAASMFSAAATGDVMYTADLLFGILDANVDQDVTWWSLSRGNAAVCRGRTVDASNNPETVTVQAGGTFQLNTGTIRIMGSST